MEKVETTSASSHWHAALGSAPPEPPRSTATLPPLQLAPLGRRLPLYRLRGFLEKSRGITDANGGVPPPSLAFFHIPLPEFHEAFSAGHVVGYKNEDVCCPKLNSGMFVAMIESGAVRGAFAGHDHNNDCAASFRGILLAYGRKTGDFCYLDLPCGGARVIALEDGGNTFW